MRLITDNSQLGSGWKRGTHSCNCEAIALLFISLTISNITTIATNATITWLPSAPSLDYHHYYPHHQRHHHDHFHHFPEGQTTSMLRRSSSACLLARPYALHRPYCFLVCKYFEPTKIDDPETNMADSAAEMWVKATDQGAFVQHEGNLNGASRSPSPVYSWQILKRASRSGLLLLGRSF